MKRFSLIVLTLLSLSSIGLLMMVGQVGGFLPPLRTALLGASTSALPAVKDSPILHLRQLLTADEVTQASLLDQHAETTRAFWKRKLSEYSSMNPEERDRRLREAELHWYLMLVIRTEDSERETRLSEIPEADRGLIASRIEEWEQLPEALQMDILRHIPALRYFGQLVSMTPEARNQALQEATQNGTSPDRLSSGWNQLDAKRRKSMFLAYQRFFTLEQEKRRKVLAEIPLPQRRTLQQRLDQLENLPVDLRQKCLQALQTYAEMTPEDRVLFRATAERWKQMEPSEHEVLRKVVKVVRRVPPIPQVRTRLQPPLPGSNSSKHLPPTPVNPEP